MTGEGDDAMISLQADPELLHELMHLGRSALILLVPLIVILVILILMTRGVRRQAEKAMAAQDEVMELAREQTKIAHEQLHLLRENNELLREISQALKHPRG